MEVPESASAENQQIRHLAVKQGYITAAQLREALSEFEKSGTQISLGEFLVKEEYISRKQLETLLHHQDKPKSSEHIPGYEFIRKLGEGGMGVVFLARQKSMDKLVAVKVLPMKLSKDKEFIDRFVREARLAGKFDHVNAVRGLDTGEHEGFYYFVMEYVDGQPLDKILSEQDVLTEERALRITMQIARALDYANKQGIIHRDIKPANIMVMKGDVAKLCDLGLAKQMDTESHMTLAGTTIGTPHYTSPELVRGDKDVDTRADIYSLGATLYHLVTGKTPFSGTSAAVVFTKHLTEESPWPADVNPNVSESCCRLIEKMMAKDQIDRYATPLELIKDMESVIDGKEITSMRLEAGKRSIAQRRLVKPSPMEKREQRPALGAKMGSKAAKKFPAWAIGSLVAAAVILVVLIASLARKEDQPPPRKTSIAKSEDEGIEKPRVEARRPVGRGPITYTKWPFDEREAKLRQQETAKGLGLPVEKTIDLGGGVKLELMLIPAGEFMMGSKYSPEEIARRGSGGRIGRYRKEHPRHRVRITKPYYMGKYEVTQEVWQKVMGANPSRYRGERNPVDQISWDDCREFMKKLNALVGKKERFTFRLPTEAEWEHACRAGTETPFHFGETITADLASYRNRNDWDDTIIRGPKRIKTEPVGSFEPNPWGLYDMAGNVNEWCGDYYKNYRRDTGDILIDPMRSQKPKPPKVVQRGGAWDSKPGMCRSACRDDVAPGSKKARDGFRVAVSP